MRKVSNKAIVASLIVTSFLILIFTGCLPPSESNKTNSGQNSTSATSVVKSTPANSSITSSGISQSATNSIPSTKVTTPSPYNPIMTTSADFPVMSRFELTPPSKPDDKIEIDFAVEVQRIWQGQWLYQTSDTLIDSKAQVIISRAGINGSYSEARRFSEVPPEKWLVNGNTSWEGNALETRYIDLKSTIILPGDGIWLIDCSFGGRSLSTFPLIHYWRIFAIANGVVVDYQSDELKSSPLAYLGYFDYGHSVQLQITEQFPLSLKLDITNPPLAGEKVTLTYEALSPFMDLKDVTVKTEFIKRTENGGIIKIPARDIVVRSGLEFGTDAFGNILWKDWQINLTKGEAQALSTTIMFPEPGEWEVAIDGQVYLPDEKHIISNNDELILTITANKSYYGWVK